MRRRTLLGGLGAVLVASKSSKTLAQAFRKVPTVGFAGSEVPLFESFLAGLRELGWKPGEDVHVIHGGGAASLDVIDRLLDQQVDVLVAPGPVRLRYAAQRQTSTPLIGIDLETDPVASGAVKTLSRPGGNITGVWLDMPEMTGKLVELLKEVVPHLTLCSVIWDSEVGHTQLSATQQSAATSGIAVQDLPFSDSTDVATLLSNAPGQAVIVLTSPRIYFRRADIAKLTATQRMPSISLFPEYARAGGLLAYGPSLSAMFRRVSSHVDQVLRGRSPADIPVERPSVFELVVNRKAADALGIKLAGIIFARADEVIE